MSTAEEKRRVLEAFNQGNLDWKEVAKYNGVSLSTARRVVLNQRVQVLPRGGPRLASTRVTHEMRQALERYLNENCLYTLRQMQQFLVFDFNGVKISLPTISRHLIGMLFTMKQARVEPSTCNSDVNKSKRQVFALKLLEHQEQNDYIVYYDKTNFNIYCRRSQGRSKKGTCAVVVLPPSQGPNLQVQCAVSLADGLVCHRLERGRILMDDNAAFVEKIYQSVKSSDTWQEHYQGKKVVIVLDNAPAHSQTEVRSIAHDDM
ncbi:hypothetical protein Ae201684P_013156 [Aphanomyces euteiches]|uniref:Tc1-like transposase DDE domain-containing protein n=1 Tax=Aphanomyces euteiches TaxID=100861 RepID=A0A6G0WS36_9STRA|nr:hypothetical protein Ae201684_012240 [Aphanomyces euteiches]KAH9096488.1 hypothetical protein Ae201684P_013156 [Aphanomyces euteiches]